MEPPFPMNTIYQYTGYHIAISTALVNLRWSLPKRKSWQGRRDHRQKSCATSTFLIPAATRTGGISSPNWVHIYRILIPKKGQAQDSHPSLPFWVTEITTWTVSLFRDTGVGRKSRWLPIGDGNVRAVPKDKWPGEGQLRRAKVFRFFFPMYCITFSSVSHWRAH